jgi:hypothetical protein
MYILIVELKSALPTLKEYQRVGRDRRILFVHGAATSLGLRGGAVLLHF